MSQKVKITKVSVKGAAPYLGLNSETGEPMFSRSPDDIMEWLCSGYRYRFNQLRSGRKKTGPDGDLIPLGDNVDERSTTETRAGTSFITAIPDCILDPPRKLEETEWFAATKRRETLRNKGKNPGKMPGFKSYKRDDHIFTAWSHGGRTAVLERVGRRSGIVTIKGRNPKAVTPDGVPCYFSIRIHVRLSEDIRPYSSVQVNWTKKQLVFNNSPLPVEKAPTEGELTVTGVDRGITVGVATDTGKMENLPHEELKRLDKEVRKHQKAQARAVKASEHKDQKAYRRAGASNRFLAHDREIARIKAKASRIVADHHRKWALDLVRESDVIVLEKLNLTAMMASPDPIEDPLRPGKYLPNGKAAKRGLNRSLGTAAMGSLGEKICYKASLSGVPVIEVDPKNTSRRCYNCGHTAKENRESQAVFLCRSCGYRDNADTNASRNTREKGLCALHADPDFCSLYLSGRAVPSVETRSDSEKDTFLTAAGSVKREPLPVLH